MTRPPDQWTSEDIARHTYGMDEAPREHDHEPDWLPGEPQPGTGFAWAIWVSAAIWCLIGAAMFWGKL